MLIRKIIGYILNEYLVSLIIALNVIVIFLEESGMNTDLIVNLDVGCTLFFVVEIISRILIERPKIYFHSVLNWLDVFVVSVSMPSIIQNLIGIEYFDLSYLLIFRTFRLLRTLMFFRILRLFPRFQAICKGFIIGLKDTLPLIFVYSILIMAIGLFSCIMFRTDSPELFGTPLDSIYTIFQLFTIEGWYEIPNALTTMDTNLLHVATIRLYFICLVFGGGIIGLSLINSVFVDAMVADNNDDLKTQLNKMSEQLDELKQLINEQNNTHKDS